MGQVLVYLHTVPGLVSDFSELSRQLLPRDIEIFHIVDEMLLKLALVQGRLSPFIYRRVADHAIAAEGAGAAAIQVTCSSISPCTDVAQQLVSIPVLKVDQPMVDRAIAMGQRIGIAATLASTLRPTADLVRQRAAAAGQSIHLETVLCEGAYDAIRSGDAPTHDRIVRDAVDGLTARSDVIILAQASMARVVANDNPGQVATPILTSPRFAVEHARQILNGLRVAGSPVQ